MAPRRDAGASTFNPDLLLEALQSTPELGPSLTEKIAFAFNPIQGVVWTSSERAQKDDLTKLATELGSFAMKLLNQNSKMMGSMAQEATKEDKENTDKPKGPNSVAANGAKRSQALTSTRGTRGKAALQPKVTEPASINNCESVLKCLADTSLLAISVLRSLETQLNMKQLDLEKAASNIVTRMIDNHLYEPALAELVQLHQRLVKVALKTSTHRKLKASASYANPTASSARKTVTLKSKTASQTSQEKPLTISELLILPLEGNSPDISLTTVVVAYIFNGIRCVIEAGSKSEIESIKSILTCDSGPWAWINHMNYLNSDLASKHWDAAYKLLWRASARSTDPRISLLFKSTAFKFYAQSTSFSATAFVEQVLRSGLNFERMTSGDAKSLKSELIPFYEEALELVNVRPNADFKASPHFNSWTDHYSNMLRKVGMYDASSSLLSILQGVSGGSQAEVVIQSSIYKYEMWGNTLAKACSPSKNTTLEGLNAVSWKQLKSSVHTCADKQNLALPYRLLKSFDGLRECCVLKPPGSSKQCTPNDLIQAVKMGLDLFDDELLVKLHDARDGYFPRIVTLLVEVYTSLSTQAFDPTIPDTYDQAHTFLSRATSLCLSHNLGKYLRWVSSAYYNIGGMFFKANNYTNAIHPLLEACNSLSAYMDRKIHNKDHQISSEDLQEIHTLISKRWEILATCHHALQNIALALEALVKALRNLSVSEFAEFRNRGSSIINDKSPCAASKLVDRYVRMYFSWPFEERSVSFRFMREILQDRILEIGEHEIVEIMDYELGALQAVGTKYDTATEEIAAIDGILQACDQTERPELYLRTSLEKAKLLRVRDVELNGPNPEKALEICRQVLEMLKDEDRFLLPSKKRDYFLAIAYSCVGMCSNELRQYDAKPFKMALQLWRKTLQKVPMFPKESENQNLLEDVAKSIDDVERASSELIELSEYFGILNQPLNRLLSLKLVLRLSSLRKVSATSFSESMLYADIAYCYLSMGYTGQAGAAISQGASLVDNDKCTLESKVYWMLAYAYYLNVVGRVEKSDKLLLDAGKLAGDSSLDKREKCGLYAIAHLVKSNRFLAMGHLIDAIDHANSYMRHLSKCVPGMLKSLSEIRTEEIVDSQLVDSEADTMTEYRRTSASLCGNLRSTRRILDCFLRIGDLQLAFGSPSEALYILKQGLQLSKLLNSHGFEAAFLENIANLEFMKDDIKGGEESANSAVLVHEKVKRDVQLKALKIEDSVDLYYDAQQMLLELMDEKFISSMEDISTTGHETPREKRLLQEGGPKRKSLKPFSGDDESLASECFLLEYLQGSIVSRIGEAMIKKGAYEDAERVLADNADITMNEMEQAEFCLTAAKVKIARILRNLDVGSMVESFNESGALNLLLAAQEWDAN